MMTMTLAEENSGVDANSRVGSRLKTRPECAHCGEKSGACKTVIPVKSVHADSLFDTRSPNSSRYRYLSKKIEPACDPRRKRGIVGP